MENTKQRLIVSTIVNAPIEKIWKYWNEPEHIMQWDHSTDDWHAPKASNDLQVGSGFVVTMASKDGAHSFDFSATYTAIIPNERIEYVMPDGREVSVIFTQVEGGYRMTEEFDAENENPRDMQIVGWQAILENFKKYIESN